ncbi:MAG TPA: tripartite tricarboxylate transporter permease [Rectinemataceae bacterium]|nr:tripartite tricarboxylate transporter permease [Rectinemataceae bacterium]
MDIIWQSMVAVFNPLTFALILVGTLWGMIAGALPGLSTSMAVILLLPFTYGMEPVRAIVMLVSCYVGGAAGGSISSILIKTPGTPEAVASTFDGYPMTQQGKSGEALGLSITASSFGTIFSALVMIIAAPALAVVAISFQSAEYFALGLLGLSCITSIGAKNQLKAVLSVLIGVAVSTVGIDGINGVERYSFGQPFLMNGINFISVMIGAFAIAEVLKNIEETSTRQAGTSLRIAGKISMKLMKFVDMLKMWKTFIVSSVIGVIIGIIPAAGGSIASLIAYGEAARSNKDLPKFGEGNPKGVIAPECGANACTGGAMVPTMVLGIPGSPVTAIIMAAFMIIGLRPGPLLLRQQPVLLNAVFLGLLASALLLFLFGRFLSRQFGHILKLPYPLLGTSIVLLGVVGAYSLGNSIYDVIVMFIFGLVGYFFDKFQYSPAGMILGLILGGIIENSLRKQIIIGDGSGWGLITRPIALVILLLAIFTFVSPMITRALKKKKPVAASEE